MKITDEMVKAVSDKSVLSEHWCHGFDAKDIIKASIEVGVQSGIVMITPEPPKPLFYFNDSTRSQCKIDNGQLRISTDRYTIFIKGRYVARFRDWLIEQTKEEPRKEPPSKESLIDDSIVNGAFVSGLLLGLVNQGTVNDNPYQPSLLVDSSDPRTQWMRGYLLGVDLFKQRNS